MTVKLRDGHFDKLDLTDSFGRSKDSDNSNESNKVYIDVQSERGDTSMADSRPDSGLG
jgi:hypothetical protein